MTALALFTTLAAACTSARGDRMSRSPSYDSGTTGSAAPGPPTGETTGGGASDSSSGAGAAGTGGGASGTGAGAAGAGAGAGGAGGAGAGGAGSQ